MVVRGGRTHRDVVIQVIDERPGIEPGWLEQIFEPFVPGSVGGPGTGQGLVIARGFAEINGGRLWAESEVGHGATFVFSLPAHELPVAYEACSA